MSTVAINNSRAITCPQAETPPIINMDNALFHGLGGCQNDRNIHYHDGIITKVENGIGNKFDMNALYPYSIIVLEQILKSGCIRPISLSAIFDCHFNLPLDVKQPGSIERDYVSLSKTGNFHPSFTKFIAQNPSLVIKKSDLMNADGKLCNEATFRSLGIYDSVQGEYLYNQIISLESVLGIALPYPTTKEGVANMEEYLEMINTLLVYYKVIIPIVDYNGHGYSLK